MTRCLRTLAGAIGLIVAPLTAETQQTSTARDSVMRDDGPTLRISGVVQLFYRHRIEQSGDNQVEPGLFRMQRVRLKAEGRVNRRVGYEVEIDPRAPQVAGLLRDAYVTLSYLPRHDIVVGQLKTPFGYENSASSSRLFTVTRSELAEGIGRGFTLRDIGIGVRGSIRLASDWRFEDEVLLVNGSGMNVQADATPRKNLWGRVGLRYRNKGLTTRWGVSFANGDQFEPIDPADPTIPEYIFTFRRLGTDVQVDHRNFMFVTEYATSNETAPAVVDASGTTSAFSVMAVGKSRRGIGPVVRYDVFEDYKRWTYGAYAGLPSSNLSFMLSYEAWEDEAGPHDGRLFSRVQVRF